MKSYNISIDFPFPFVSSSWIKEVKTTQSKEQIRFRLLWSELNIVGYSVPSTPGIRSTVSDSGPVKGLRHAHAQSLSL